ncbi:hypothetical protein CCYA_CCYA12G3311 [Cyanidiococcus yangmingshanensis]|nr:hypothetical protein CCYA_CCYA12G3311 [Cyanidiococcus yangmingshanensis]
MIRLFQPLSADEAAALAYRALHDADEDQRRNRKQASRYPVGCTLGALDRFHAIQRCQPLDASYAVKQQGVRLAPGLERKVVWDDIRCGLTMQAPEWVSTYTFTRETSPGCKRLLPATNSEPIVLVVNARHLRGLLWTHMVLERVRCSDRGVTWRTVPGYHFLDGEESFYLLPDNQDEAALYAVCSVSRASHWLARLASPYVRLCQHRFLVESMQFLQQRWNTLSKQKRS